MGKTIGATTDSGWGDIEIVVYPVGTSAPAVQQAGIAAALH
jgi:hypothetical protein